MDSTLSLIVESLESCDLVRLVLGAVTFCALKVGVCAKSKEDDVELAELEVGKGLSSGLLIAVLYRVLMDNLELSGRKDSCRLRIRGN